MNSFRLFMRYGAPLFIILIALYVLVSYAKRGPSVTKIVPDPLITTTAFKDIRSSLIDYLSQHPKATAKELLNAVQIRFPFINRIRMRLKSNGVHVINFSVDMPLLMLNNSCLITLHGDKVAADYYIPAIYQELFALRTATLETDKQTIKDIVAFVSSMPAWVCENYTCTWVDKTLITLQDKTSPQLVIKAYDKTAFNDHIHDALQRLKNYCLAQTAYKKRKETHGQWIIDIRFKNLMVLSRQKGEQ
jgi:hypothetical protein